MVTLSVSMNDDDFVSEVRTALAGMEIIPTDTILQKKDRVVVPSINDSLTDSQKNDIDQDEFDTAVIMRTAEKSFKSWLPKIRKSLGELEVEIDPDSFEENLEDEAKDSLSRIGIIEDDGGAVEFVDHTQGDLWL